MNTLKKSILRGLLGYGVLGFALGVPAVSHAQAVGDEDHGWYIGASANRLSADFENENDVSFDDSDTAGGAQVGYMFTDLFGIELGYLDLGSYSAKGENPGNNINIDADAFTGSLVLNFSVTPMLDLYGKFGAFYIDSESTTRINGTTFIGSDDGVEPYGTLGLEADFGQFGVFGEYSKVDTDINDLSLDIVSVGVRFEVGY